MLKELLAFGDLPSAAVPTSRAHDDIHYLWKLRKALAVLVDEENVLKVSEQALIDLHTSIVRGMVAVGKNHYFDDWSSTLDDTLPEDLKLASEGYFPPEQKEGLLSMTASDYIEREIYMEHEVVRLWTAPTKRKNVPASHFFDPKNKKYPYKNPDGTINCGGVKAAKQAAGGARSGKKASPALRAKINRVWDKYCAKKK